MVELRDLFMRLGAKETGTRELQLESGTVIETITASDVKPFITVRLSIPMNMPASCKAIAEKGVTELNQASEHAHYRIAVDDSQNLVLEMLNSVWRIRETPTIRMCEELLDVYEASIRASLAYLQDSVTREMNHGKE